MNFDHGVCNWQRIMQDFESFDLLKYRDHICEELNRDKLDEKRNACEDRHNDSCRLHTRVHAQLEYLEDPKALRLVHDVSIFVEPVFILDVDAVLD